MAGGSLKGSYLKGMAMHVTNPKAIFVWLSIVALGLPPEAKTSDAFVIVAGCAMIAMCVFFGYALAFSTSASRNFYRRVHRWFNAALAGMFAFAGGEDVVVAQRLSFQPRTLMASSVPTSHSFGCASTIVMKASLRPIRFASSARV